MSLSKEIQFCSPLQYIANTSSPKIEYLPFIKRRVYLTKEDEDGWYYIMFPTNKGECRDIPSGARFHHSVKERMAFDPLSDRVMGASSGSECFQEYRPTNQLPIKNRKEFRRLNEVDATKPTGHDATNSTGLETASPLRFRVFQKGESETDNIYIITENKS